MNKEIERRFLVKTTPWTVSTPYLDIVQGYLNIETNPVIRVRYQQDSELALKKGYLTIKGPRINGECNEFEYEIPHSDAEYMIKNLTQFSISKRRYLLKYEHRFWEVDEFKNLNQGLCIAEIELDSAQDQIVLPTWVGEEVTHDYKYSNSNLAVDPYQLW